MVRLRASILGSWRSPIEIYIYICNYLVGGVYTVVYTTYIYIAIDVPSKTFPIFYVVMLRSWSRPAPVTLNNCNSYSTAWTGPFFGEPKCCCWVGESDFWGSKTGLMLGLFTVYTDFMLCLYLFDDGFLMVSSIVCP